MSDMRPGEPLRRAATPSKSLPGWRLAKAAFAVVLLLGAGSIGFYFAEDLVSPRVVVTPTSSGRDPTIASPRTNSPASGPLRPRERPATDPRQRIVEFVDAYDGGDCFFVLPEAVDEAKASLDGLGRSVAPFELLDDAFKRENGFEPSIGVHEVMPAQCPAVNFLFRTRHQRGVAPRLEADTAGLKDGGPLTGSISEFGGGNVDVLLVADDGYVRSLTGFLKPGGDARSFAVGIRKTDPGPPRPQLLVAVTSSKPLEALKLPPDGLLAEEVFPRLLAEASQSGQTLGVSAKYFMLEK